MLAVCVSSLSQYEHGDIDQVLFSSFS